MKRLSAIPGIKYLNTNEMVSDYLFSKMMIMDQIPMDFDFTEVSHRRPKKRR